MRLVAHHVLRRGVGRHHRDVGANARQKAQDVALDAIVDDGDAEGRLGLLAIAFVPCPGRLVPFIGLARGDFLGEVQPDKTGKRPGLGDQRLAVQFRSPQINHDAMRHAFFADQRGQRAGVDARHRRDVVLLEPAIQRQQVAIVGRMFSIGPDHQAAHHRRGGLDVFAIGADNADMGEGEGHDLAGVRRIAEDLLIAGHGGIEADLADGGRPPRRIRFLRRKCRRPASGRRVKNRSRVGGVGR